MVGSQTTTSKGDATKAHQLSVRTGTRIVEKPPPPPESNPSWVVLDAKTGQLITDDSTTDKKLAEGIAAKAGGSATVVLETEVDAFLKNLDPPPPDTAVATELKFMPADSGKLTPAQEAAGAKRVRRP